MIRDEIVEYPYDGRVYSIVQGDGDDDDVATLLYEGKLDVHQVSDEEGKTLQTSSYIISMPLTKDSSGAWIVPKKGDKIDVARYGEEICFTVDNAEPSQLGGVSVYSSRNSWQ